MERELIEAGETRDSGALAGLAPAPGVAPPTCDDKHGAAPPATCTVYQDPPLHGQKITDKDCTVLLYILLLTT
jgi:hypothetical protein